MSEADMRHDISVQEYVASLKDPQMAEDTRALIKMMQQISGEKPQLYGFGTIGFGIYHYKYESGRSGSAHTLGFYPRKGKITLYLMDGTKKYSKLLDQLGKYTTTGYCLYIKRLSDIKLAVLEQILRQSYEHINSEAAKGPINNILWQA